jgi:serine protease Do
LRAQASYAQQVKQAAPAVVNIYARRVERSTQPRLFDDPLFRRFFGDLVPPDLPRERVAQSLGSGVIVDPSGVIVTNNHVIEGATEIVVVLADRREFAAKPAAADARSDLAVLRIDASGELPYLRFGDSDRLEVGDVVLAIGNPFGVGQTVTSGIVSALGRTGIGALDTQSFIQTDAAINPGNSGGALITLDGRLAGINTAIFSRSGGSLGIGFAIPANLVATTLAQVLSGQGIIRPWLGVKGQAIDADSAGALGLQRPLGVLVLAVYPGSAADKAGIRAGDAILKIDGREVFDPRDLKYRMATRKLGESARFEVRRGRSALNLSVRVEKAPEAPPRRATALSGEHPLAGATVANLSPALADELGIDPFLKGVAVTKIERGSIAARTGFRVGDVILKVNGIGIADVGVINRALAAAGEDWRISLDRGGQTLEAVIR